MSAALKMPEPFESEISGLADELADAMANAASALSTLGAAEAHLDKISTRMSDLARERGEIVSRRSAGREEPDDGQRLALIQADTEGLKAMLPDATERVSKARASHSAASAIAAKCRDGIARAETLAAREALVTYAGVLADRLFDTVKAIEEAGRRAAVGGRPPWGASKQLREMLRTLAVQRGDH